MSGSPDVERRDEEVDFRVLKASSIARSENTARTAAAGFEDLEMLAATSANSGRRERLRVGRCLQGLDEASAGCLAPAGHSDRRMASLLWGQRLVHEVCRAKGVEHASAWRAADPHAARSQDFDLCLLQLLEKENTARVAANALCGGSCRPRARRFQI